MKLSGLIFVCIGTVVADRSKVGYGTLYGQLSHFFCQQIRNGKINLRIKFNGGQFSGSIRGSICVGTS